MSSIRAISFSSRVTKHMGAQFAARCAQHADMTQRSCIVFLQGDLGGGKTTFTSGILSYFGVQTTALSPTFVLMKRYKTKKHRNAIQEIVHIDAYRLTSATDMEMLNFSELEKQPHTLICIEWPERIAEARYNPYARVQFSHGKISTERALTFRFRL